VAPDSYFIEVVPPVGLDVTAMDVGTLDDIDSDFDGELLTTDDFIFSPSASGLDLDCGFTTSGGP
jgi:hypothetical protein